MQRLRRVLRLIRHAAFSFCCVMAVVCLGLLICNVAYHTRICYDEVGAHGVLSQIATEVTLQDGVVTATRRDVPWEGVVENIGDVHVRLIYKPKTGFTVEANDYPGGRWETLNLVRATRESLIGCYLPGREVHWLFRIPLLVLVTLFGVWPLAALWRRWRGTKAGTVQTAMILVVACGVCVFFVVWWTINPDAYRHETPESPGNRIKNYGEMVIERESSLHRFVEPEATD